MTKHTEASAEAEELSNDELFESWLTEKRNELESIDVESLCRMVRLATRREGQQQLTSEQEKVRGLEARLRSERELGKWLREELYHYMNAPVQTSAEPAATGRNPPYSNCQYQICDLPGQCRGEGACHHPKTRERAESEDRRDAERYKELIFAVGITEIENEIESLRQQLAEANAKVAELEGIANSDDGAGGEGMRLYLENKDMTKKIADLTARLEAQDASEPVATICMPDPDDERDGVRFNLKDWEKLNALPAGTKLYTTPQPTQTVKAAVAEAIRKAAEVCRSYYSVEGIAQRCEAEIIAMPHDDTALREICLKVAEEVHTEGDIGGVGVAKRLEAIVNRVLKG